MKLNFSLCLILLILTGSGAWAQGVNIETTYTQGGVTRAAQQAYGELNGSPYLYNNWELADVKLADNKIYSGVLLKYDQVSGSIYFKNNQADSTMMFTLPVTEFKFTGKANTPKFISGLLPAYGATANTFYQLLSDGKTKLLKRTIKVINEARGYNSGEITRQVNETTVYYIAQNNQPLKVKGAKGILSALYDRADKLNIYINEQKLNFKEDNDYVRIVAYYNSL